MATVHIFPAVVAYRNVHHKIQMSFIKINKPCPTLPQHVAPCALVKICVGMVMSDSSLTSQCFPKCCTWYITKDVNDKVALRSNVSDANDWLV